MWWQDWLSETAVYILLFGVGGSVCGLLKLVLNR